jgi:hypothetical protein
MYDGGWMSAAVPMEGHSRTIYDMAKPMTSENRPGGHMAVPYGGFQVSGRQCVAN